MILLIGMLLFKEEDVQKKKREEHLSVLYTPLLRKTESEEISFFTPFGGRSLERPIQPKRTTPSCMNPTGNAKRE